MFSFPSFIQIAPNFLSTLNRRDQNIANKCDKTTAQTIIETKTN